MVSFRHFPFPPAQVGNATQRGERPGDSYFSPQAHRNTDGAERAGPRAGGEHKSNGIGAGDKAVSERARGRAGTAGARTTSNDTRLPELAWAAEMTPAANRANPQTIARGHKPTPSPSQWPAAGGTLYGSRAGVGNPTNRQVRRAVRAYSCLRAGGVHEHKQTQMWSLLPPFPRFICTRIQWMCTSQQLSCARACMQPVGEPVCVCV